MLAILLKSSEVAVLEVVSWYKVFINVLVDLTIGIRVTRIFWFLITSI